jgi:hypothetical protein
VTVQRHLRTSNANKIAERMSDEFEETSLPLREPDQQHIIYHQYYLK